MSVIIIFLVVLLMDFVFLQAKGEGSKSRYVSKAHLLIFFPGNSLGTNQELYGFRN